MCLLASAQGNEMELCAFRQEVSRAYAFWLVLRAMRWNFMPLGKKYPGHTPFGECSGQEPGLRQLWRVLQVLIWLLLLPLPPAASAVQAGPLPPPPLAPAWGCLQ